MDKTGEGNMKRTIAEAARKIVQRKNVRLTTKEFNQFKESRMTMTEKRTAEEIPSSLIELLHAHSINTEFVAAANKMYVTSAPLPYFEAACKMYAAQELDAYKARLKEEINKIKTNSESVVKYAALSQIIELIDKL